MPELLPTSGCQPFAEIYDEMLRHHDADKTLWYSYTAICIGHGHFDVTNKSPGSIDGFILCHQCNKLHHTKRLPAYTKWLSTLPRDFTCDPSSGRSKAMLLRMSQPKAAFIVNWYRAQAARADAIRSASGLTERPLKGTTSIL
jgi:hypothetical protein